MADHSDGTSGPGRRVGQYEIIRELGRGGMARVHLARQVTLNREVALKELSVLHADSPEAVARFLRESRLAGSLNHPNVVTVLEYFEVDATPYIAMEYVRRGSLRPYVGRLGLAGFAGVMEGVLAGLTHAQGQGIVHRDLKPENIMVTDEGRVKIADFGIAKATQLAAPQSFATRTGAMIGTPGYMAPEQILGGSVGSWTDLYAVGVIAYEQIVGHPPFHDTDLPTAVLMRHLHDPIPAPVEVRPDTDPELSGWIERLVAKDPAERTQDPIEAWEQLEEILLRLLGPRWRRAARLPDTPGLAKPARSSAPVSLPERDPSRFAPTILTEPGRRDGAALGRPPAISSLRRGRLPHPSTQFLGRDRELAEVGTLLRRSAARLLTLTGAGGCGKTRLALQVAHRCGDRYRDGVAFVELADLTDGSLIAPTVCEALGLAENSLLTPAEQLRDRLANEELLLILDNCEHVIGEAAEVVASILSERPSGSVLATSREPLRIDGEQVYRVPSMSLPSNSSDDLAHVGQAEAAQLFVARAIEQRPSFKLDEDSAPAVARICRKLDGLPMAIELAAVRMRSMSIAELDARLTERFALLRSGTRTATERQRTLRGLVDWSYRLLTEPEQLLLARLSVFPVSGFDLEAAEAIRTGDATGGSGTLDDLDALVYKSLVQAEDSYVATRYRLLETVRAYAADRLADLGEAFEQETRASHRRHYLALAESAKAHLYGPDRLAWRTRLANEQDNLRIALDDCLRERSPEPGLHLIDALRGFWTSWRPAADALRLITRQLARPDAQQPTLARGRALLAASQVCFRPLGDFEKSIAYAEDALAIGHRRRDEHLCADALRYLAWGDLRRGKLAESLAGSEKAIEIARSLDDHALLIDLLVGRAGALSSPDGEAGTHLLEALELAQEKDDPYLAATTLGNLGYLALVAGDPRGAREHIEKAVETLLELEEVDAVSVLNNLGLATHLAGDSTLAASRFRQGLELARKLGDLEAVALAVLGLAGTASDPSAAATMLGASDALLLRLRLVLDPVEWQLRDDTRARLEAVLGGYAFARAYKLGEAYNTEDAISFALSRSTDGER